MSEEQEDAVALRAEAALRELLPMADIPLQVSVEVSRIRLRVKDIVQLELGSVIELKKNSGEPFEICINGVLVGRGEVVAVEQLSGIRIVEVQKSGSLSL
jgi:flagellar motor switch protein FliN/FliY